MGPSPRPSLARRLFGDTLTKRLFLLFWLGLMLSHFFVRESAHHPGHYLAFDTPAPGHFEGPPGLDRFGGPPGPGGPRGFLGGPPLSLPLGMLLVDIGARDHPGRALVARGAVGVAAAAPLHPYRASARAFARRTCPRIRIRPPGGARGGPSVQRHARTPARAVHRAQPLHGGHLTHDLRTPLTRLRLRLEQLPERSPVAERARADIVEMDAMIDTVLSYLREEADPERPQRVDAYALAQSLVDDLAEQGRPVTCGGAPAVANVPPQGLRRCVGNLVDNGLRHGKHVSVEVRTVG